MSVMNVIGEGIEKLYDWANDEENDVKRTIKSFIAGFVDGFEYGCLVIGNFMFILTWIIWFMNKFSKKKED